MIPLNPKAISIVKPPKAQSFEELTSEDGIQVGMDFERQMVVIEIDQESSTILTLPIQVAYSLALKMMEATSIINFSQRMGLSFTTDEEETKDE